MATYTATGPNADMATWTLSGDDAGSFSISTAGVLRFRSAPDYENAADADMDNEYMVTVMADDGTYMAMRDVAVTVTAVEDDAPVIVDGTLLARYAGDDGVLQKSEVIAAIIDYQGEVEGITKAFVIGLIITYQTPTS